jgi:formamidopyrimidine-DNA glycosylase
MPELPEVETVARQLDPELRGRRIERLEVLDGRWSRPVPPEQLGEAVSGATIRGLGVAASTCCWPWTGSGRWSCTCG